VRGSVASDFNPDRAVKLERIRCGIHIVTMRSTRAGGRNFEIGRYLIVILNGNTTGIDHYDREIGSNGSLRMRRPFKSNKGNDENDKV
jgi:hypothetical protein